jgi:hypothetical protein
MKIRYFSIPVLISFPITTFLSILVVIYNYTELLNEPRAFFEKDPFKIVLVFAFLIPVVVFIFQYWEINIDKEKIAYKDYFLSFFVKYKLTFYWEDIIEIKIYRNAYTAVFTIKMKEGIREFSGEMSQKQVLAIVSYIEDKNIPLNYRDDLNPRLSRRSD